MVLVLVARADALFRRNQFFADALFNDLYFSRRAQIKIDDIIVDSVYGFYIELSLNLRIVS